jgi:HAMP domain-containing protein
MLPALITAAPPSLCEPPRPSQQPRFFRWLSGLLLALGGAGAGVIWLSYQLPHTPVQFSIIWLTLAVIGLSAAMLFWMRHAWREAHQLPLERLADALQACASNATTAPLWGRDRTDSIGAVAQAAEQARRHWCAQPDVIVGANGGQVPLRFNGVTGALFEALKQELSSAISTVTRAASQLQAGAEASQAGVRGFAEQVQDTLQHLTHATLQGVDRLGQLHGNMADSAAQLRGLQEQTVRQLATLVPELQERADGLHAIVRLTGQQTATSLQQLQHSTHLIRDTAQLNHSIGQKFSHEADELTQRLFAAVTLLRSSGKVLAETNEVARSRMHDILGSMTQAETALTQTLDTTRAKISLTNDMAAQLADLSVRTENNANSMATAVDGLLQHNASLSQQVDVSGKRLDSMLNNVDALQHKFAASVATVATRSEQIEQVLRHLHTQHQQVITELARSGGDSASHLGRLAIESEQLIARIEAQLALAGAIADSELRRLGDATAAAAESAQLASNQLTEATQLLLFGGGEVANLTTGMTDQLARLEHDVTASLATVQECTEQLVTHNIAQFNAVHDKVEVMSQRLAALGQLTGTMGQVAAQLGQLIPQVGGAESGDMAQLRLDMMQVVQELLGWQKTINATLETLPAHLQHSMNDTLDPQLIMLRGQLEATRQDMMAVVSEQQHEFGRRFDRSDEVSGFIADSVTAGSSANGAATTKPDNAQLANVLREIVTALSQINRQISALDQRLPEPAQATAPSPEQVDHALSAVTDIFASLRDRGDDVINRLNAMASHLQTAAEKPEPEG